MAQLLQATGFNNFYPIAVWIFEEPTASQRKTLRNTGLHRLFAGYLPLNEWLSARNIDTMASSVCVSIGSCLFLTGEPYEYQHFNCQTLG